VKQIVLSKLTWLERMRARNDVASIDADAEASWLGFVAQMREWYGTRYPSEYDVSGSEAATQDSIPEGATESLLFSRAVQNVCSTICIWGVKKTRRRG
jgi:hypothetical protein